MKYVDNKMQDIKIAYIGGGSRGWAWGLMGDLAGCSDMSGDVYLYDIDFEAAQHNEIIGNLHNDSPEAKTVWHYHAAKTAQEAMIGADFVIISIMPGTYDEMESDVHSPEKYGIYQSVGDTSGPGGILRAMRTVPMFEEIGENIKKYCPKAWVINYTNPMTLCVRTLYRVFPEVKAYGCCHEVFGTQQFLCTALADICGIENVDRSEIRVNPVSVNHFTWLTKASYKDIDMFPVYAEFVEKYHETGYTKGMDEEWMNSVLFCSHRVKMDLFRRYGYIAAAGDRHLAEFCSGKWYLKDPQTVRQWGFTLTPVSYRKQDIQGRLDRSQRLRNGEEAVTVRASGEEGVRQLRAILGLCEPLVTNVNLPNRGQIPNLPLGAVVETNAVFSANGVIPVLAGEIPTEIYPLISRICGEQEMLNEGIAKRDLNQIFSAFAADPLVTCSLADAKELFKEMVWNTKTYLGSYDLSSL